MRACVHACVHVRVWLSCSNQQLLGEEEEEREGVGIKSRKRGRGENNSGPIRRLKQSGPKMNYETQKETLNESTDTKRHFFQITGILDNVRK